MFLSKKCEYALKAVLYLAVNSSYTNKIGIKEIARELEQPEYFTGKILQDLVRQDLVDSAKGPGGGFYLTDPKKDLPLIILVERIDGLKTFTKCGLGLSECSDEHPCPLHDQFKPYREGLKNLFSSNTINDLSLDVTLGQSHLTS